MAPIAVADLPEYYSSGSGANGKPRYIDGAVIPDVQKSGGTNGHPVVIHLSDEEFRTGVTKPETVQELLTAFHEDGFVVLENAIDDDLVDRLYAVMVKQNEEYLTKSHMRWNQGATTKNVSQIPPLTPEYLSRDFYANPHMIRVVENLLGPKPELRFINSNVAVPGGTTRQAVHSDVHHTYPKIPFGIVMNIYLQDSDEYNGVTEVWCGTHNAYPQREQQKTSDIGWIKKDHLQKQGKIKPPVQPIVRKGSICFRDLRLWHAGMPNRSDKHRIMLAIDYFAQWYQCPMTVQLPRSMKETIEKEWEGISTAGIEWVDGDIDSLDIPFSLNMTQDPTMGLTQTEKGFEDWRARMTGQHEFDRGAITEQNWYTE